MKKTSIFSTSMAVAVLVSVIVVHWRLNACATAVIDFMSRVITLKGEAVAPESATFIVDVLRSSVELFPGVSVWWKIIEKMMERRRKERERW